MSAYFLEEIQVLVVSHVRCVRFMNDKIVPHSWSEASARVVRALLDAGVLSPASIQGALDAALRTQGRICYEQTSWTYPDHASSPHALAYAIAVGELSPQEIAVLEFDHGQTVASFVSEYGGVGVLDRMYRRLLNYCSEGAHQ